MQSNPLQSGIGYKAVADIGASADRTVSLLAYTSLTASRVVNLAASKTFDPSQEIVIADASGNASPTAFIAITPNGAETINGINGPVAIAVPYGQFSLRALANGGWVYSAGSAGSFANITAAGFIRESVGNGLTAAGTTRADALALTRQINNVTTAAAGTGVILPASGVAGIGAVVVIYNDGANPIKVYGAGTDTIDGSPAATGVTLTNALRCAYTCVAANTWLSAQLGAVSA